MWYHFFGSFAANPKPIKTIDIDERVVAYGDGFFTTMAVRNGEIEWLDYHVQRIFNSAFALQFIAKNPPSSPMPQAIRSHLNRFAEQLQEGVLKLIVCRQNQPVRGYGFVDGQVNAWVKLMPMTLTGSQMACGIKQQPAIHAACLHQQIACLPKPIAGLKLLNAQDKVLASGELITRQQTDALIGEGLVQDVLGDWVEGTISNVFYQLADQSTWYTPPINHSGVNGVMRQVLLDKLPAMGEPVRERALTDDDLVCLTALFFCNAVRGVIPVTQLYLPNGQALVVDAPKIFAKRP